MNTILNNVVAVEISDALDRQRLTPDFDFVTLHRLLDGSTDITYTYIDTRFLQKVSAVPLGQRLAI